MGEVTLCSRGRAWGKEAKKVMAQDDRQRTAKSVPSRGHVEL